MRCRGFEVVDKKYRHYGEVEILLPRRSTKYSAGYDFTTPHSFTIHPGCEKLIPTDVKAYMLNNEYLDINIRSSFAIKKNLRLKNVVGIIDSDYYSNKGNDGNIIIKLVNEGDFAVKVNQYEKIAQGIFKQYLITDDDCPISEERVGGIGSTENK